MKRCWLCGRPDRVMLAASPPVSALSVPVSTAMLAAPIVNGQHVRAFAVIELVPIQSAVMFWPLARVVETLEYQMETVTPAAAVPWPFVNSRAFVQVLAAVSMMDKWSLVFPLVVVRLSVARTMTPRLPAVSAAEVGNAHVWELVLLFAVQKEPTLAKGASVMLNALLVAPVSPLAAAVSVYPAPDLSMEMLLKVATPPTAATVRVPESVPAAGLVPIARVMEFVAVVTRAPLASCTCTWIAGEIATVGAALEGWTLKASCAGGPAAAALKSAPDWLTVADPLSVHAWETVAAPLTVDPPYG